MSDERATPSELGRKHLEDSLERAELLRINGELNSLRKILGNDAFEALSKLSQLTHAGRGVALTLIAYKNRFPDQDIRAHKEELPHGFSARTIDTRVRVTVPFLLEKNLPGSVETHWLTQTFSYAGVLSPPSFIKIASFGQGRDGGGLWYGLLLE